MKKIIIVILLTLLLSAIGGIYYFNTAFLPAFLKETIQDKGYTLINRNISFDSIEYKIGKGLLIKNLRIAQKEHPDRIFFQAQEISSEIPLIPLIKEKKIIMPQISIRGFSASLLRTDTAVWNFSDLLVLKKNTDDQLFQILIGKIILTQGQLLIEDQTGAMEPTQFSVAQIQAALSLPQKINFLIDGSIPADQAKILVKGSYDISQRSAAFNAQAANIDLLKKIFPLIPSPPPLTQAFIRHANLNILWQQATVIEAQGDLAADIRLSVENVATHSVMELRGIQLSIKKDILSLALKTLLLDQTSCQFQDSVNFSGQIQMDTIAFTKEERLDVFDEQKKSHFSLSGNAVIKPEKLKINTAEISSNQISLAALSLTKSPDDMVIQTALSSENITITQNAMRISGALHIPSAKISSTQNTWTILAPFSLKGAAAEIHKTLSLQSDLDVSAFEMIQSPHHLTITGSASGSATSFSFPDGKSGNFIPQDVAFNIRHQTSNPAGPQYEINTTISDGSITRAIPQLGDIKNIQGKIAIANDRISLDNVQAFTQGVTANINGDIRSFATWTADLAIHATDVPIQEWLYLIKDVIEPYGLAITGTTDISLAVQGSLLPPSHPTFSVDATIQTADISSSKYPYAFKNLKGGLRYSENFFSWEDLQFQFQNEPYESSGSLRRFNAPIISARIRGRDLNLFASAESINGSYEISRADLKTKLSTLTGSGKITPDKTSPRAQANIQGHLVLSDLEQLHPMIKQKIAEWDIRGRGNITLNYAGILNDPLNARFSLTYQSDRTSVKSYHFDNLNIKTTQPNPYENIFDVGTLFHDGKVTISGNIKFEKDFPFKAQASLSDINLAKLKNDFPIKDQKIEGSLAANLFLQGNAKQTASFVGQGDIKIDKGYFVKPNLLKGIISLILTQEYQDVVFTDAKAKLFIRDNRLRLADIFAKSSAVDLTGFGWIDINKNIDFSITPNFRIPSSMKTDLLKSSTKNVIEKYFAIRATGSVMKPKYSTQIDPAAVVQDAADIIGDGVQNLFKGLGF